MKRMVKPRHPDDIREDLKRAYRNFRRQFRKELERRNVLVPSTLWETTMVELRRELTFALGSRSTKRSGLRSKVDSLMRSLKAARA